LEEPGLDKRCKSNKEPGLTNQRLVRIIKKNPCRKARLLGIKRETFESKFIPSLETRRDYICCDSVSDHRVDRITERTSSKLSIL
jgi:hypothetical protein